MVVEIIYAGMLLRWTVLTVGHCTPHSTMFLRGPIIIPTAESPRTIYNSRILLSVSMCIGTDVASKRTAAQLM